MAEHSTAAHSTGPHSTGPLRVLHLAGSAEDDFLADVSLLYARDCLTAVADPERYVALVAHVSPDGSWRFPADLSPAALAAADPVPFAEAVAVVAGLGVDLVVPQMFCLSGMTHHRALLELLGLPYVGNRPAVMALGADKALARAVVAAAGVTVPEAHVVPGGPEAGAADLALPVVVKPVAADNSVGVSLVHEQGDLAAAVEAAREHGGRALVETYVPLGREVRCGVVEVDGELVCLPLEEYAVDTDTKPVRDQADKLRRADDGDLALVAKDAEHAWIVDPADPVCERVWTAARRAYRALGCRHYGLFDFRIDPDGEPWFLEAGLYCSYARTSVVAVMARAAGIDLAQLFRLAVDDALAHP